MHQNSPFSAKKIKKFSGEGALLPRPLPQWGGGGTPPPHVPPPSAPSAPRLGTRLWRSNSPPNFSTVVAPLISGEIRLQTLELGLDLGNQLFSIQISTDKTKPASTQPLIVTNDSRTSVTIQSSNKGAYMNLHHYTNKLNQNKYHKSEKKTVTTYTPIKQQIKIRYTVEQ